MSTDDEITTPSSPSAADIAAKAAAAVGTSNYVYIKSSDHAWVPARLVESTTEQAQVSIPHYKDEQAIQSDGGKSAKGPAQKEVIKLDDYPNKALPLQNVDEHGMLKQVEDMVDLSFLHEAAILYNLKSRHLQGMPYTRTGDIIIACNPYQWIMELYSEERRTDYANALVWDTDFEGDARATVEPHVYETSSMAFRGLAVEGEDQSVLVSGESGAGKTETVKILMSHLASIQQGQHLAAEAQPQSLIVERVIRTNPLLEAFGNAKTLRNDNSSRFGKYLQLQFDAEDPTLAAYSGRGIPSCILAGSKCEVYLLEKSRVVSHEEEERTYHVFYQLLAAPEETKLEIWDGLEGTDNDSFLYVGYTDTDTIEGKTDAERFQLTRDALALVGVKDEKFITLMRAIFIVLQLGNLAFEAKDGDDDKSTISSSDELTQLSSLMGIDEETIQNSLTQRTVRARNEEYKVPLKPDAAKESCDALAKEIYSKTFLWLVRTINDATTAEYNYDGDKTCGFGLIGLLDIFGFESFVVNRFEQLCINYANEKLQQKFTQDIFRSVQAEYEFEGIAMGEITYEDNVDVLDLVEGRLGLIALLNEECVRPKGNDLDFVSKVKTMNMGSDVIIVEKSSHDYEFGVKHYAGPVVYDATNFVTKNQDSLPSDLLTCAKQSTNAIVANELENDSMMNPRQKAGSSSPKAKRKSPPKHARAPPKRSGSRLVQQTVWTKFKTQLSSLMTSLGETRTRYIRCIKPNTLKEPHIMMHTSTVEQLRCAGVVAAVTISRSAFPNRLEHEIVLGRFKSLWVKGEHHAVVTTDDSDAEGNPEDAARRDVEHMLTLALKSMETEKDGKTVKAFVIGKTRAYFRAGALEHLEGERLRGLSTWAIEIQRMARGNMQKTRYTMTRNAAIKAVAQIRMFLQLRRFLRLRAACIIIQCLMRVTRAKMLLVERRRTFRATEIQTMWRMIVARAAFQKNRNASVVIQAITRGALQRPKYRIALHEKREEAKLENQLKSLQRKLEEAETRRIEAEKKAEAKAKEVVVVKEAPATPSAPAAAAEEAVTPGPAAPSPGQLTAQQQTLMDESGKMLEYLRKEVFKLRSQNSQLRTDFDLLKENNQRLMDANASAGASFAALNQHAKQLNKANTKLQTEVQTYKQQLQKQNLTLLEIKEELKMKQATYIAEVHSRLQYQKTMNEIVDIIQDECRDSHLVEEVLMLSDECESAYENGPTGLAPGPRIFGGSGLGSPPHAGDPRTDTSLASRFKSFFG